MLPLHLDFMKKSTLPTIDAQTLKCVRRSMDNRLHFDDCLRPRPQLDLIQADAEEFAPFVDGDRETPAILSEGVHIRPGLILRVQPKCHLGNFPSATDHYWRVLFLFSPGVERILQVSHTIALFVGRKQRLSIVNLADACVCQGSSVSAIQWFAALDITTFLRSSAEMKRRLREQ